MADRGVGRPGPRRAAQAKLAAPPEPPNRYERAAPGELIHIDVKKLGRIGRVGERITGHVAGGACTPAGLGGEAVHVAVDDFSRLAHVEVLADEKAATAVGFLTRAVAFSPATASPLSAS